jgi:hypothetical protein
VDGANHSTIPGASHGMNGADSAGYPHSLDEVNGVDPPTACGTDCVGVVGVISNHGAGISMGCVGVVGVIGALVVSTDSANLTSVSLGVHVAGLSTASGACCVGVVRLDRAGIPTAWGSACCVGVVGVVGLDGPDISTA